MVEYTSEWAAFEEGVEERMKRAGLTRQENELARIDIDTYQQKAVELATYPNVGHNMVYPALGLVGEAGEVAEKIKKIWRNHDNMDGKILDDYKKEEIVKELGDVAWYIAATCEELGVHMSDVLIKNIEKLQDRQRRGVIKSEGDNR